MLSHQSFPGCPQPAASLPWVLHGALEVFLGQRPEWRQQKIPHEAGA